MRAHKGKRKRSDVPTQAVLEAVNDYRQQFVQPLPGLPRGVLRRPVEFIAYRCTVHPKVAMRAMEREIDRGLIDWGVNPYIGWLTSEGTVQMMLGRLSGGES